MGQQLSEPDDIPARVLILLQGQARLVGRHNGRLTTVGKFGPGSVIGAASLLGGQPCENVVASQEVVACAIPDETWLTSTPRSRASADGVIVSSGPRNCCSFWRP